MIRIEPYSEKFEKDHIAFATKFWKKKRRSTPEYIYWKLRMNKSPKSFILALDGDKIVGQFGLIPCELILEGKLYKTQWACDLIVDNDYRGKGIATMLYEYAHNQKEITLGSNPSAAASKSMQRNGYISIPASWKLVFPMKLGEILKLKGRKSTLLDTIYNPFLVLIKLVFKFKRINFKDISIEEYIHNYDAHIQKPALGINYNNDFFDWRLNKFKNYYPGADCYKKDNNNYFTGCLVNKDYIITSYNLKGFMSFFEMIAYIIKKNGVKNISKIKLFSNNDNESRALRFLGFIKFRTRIEVIFNTKNPTLEKQMKSKRFYYTLMDSDSNI